MAVIDSIIAGRSSQSVGNITLRRVKGRTIASQKVQSNSSKSINQVKQRMRFKWASYMRRQLAEIVGHSFVKRGAYESSTNAFMSAAMPYALTIGGTEGSLVDFPFAPAGVPISRGNVVSYGVPATITGSGTTAENVTTRLGGAFVAVEGNSPFSQTLIKQRGLTEGQMLTFIVVIFDPSIRATVTVYKRCLFGNEWVVSNSPKWLEYMDEATGQVSKGGCAAVGAATIVSVNARAANFDCSSENLAVVPRSIMFLVYGGASLTDAAIKPLNEVTADELLFDIELIGWEVDTAEVLDPTSLGYTALPGNHSTIGDNVVDAA